MKRIILIFLLTFTIVNILRAQLVDSIATKKIDSAIPLFSKISDFKELDNIQLVGLGDVAEVAKETKKNNTAFAAYLIQNKKFRNILIPFDDWVLRPLNSYLISGKTNDSLEVVSLIKNIFESSYRFKNKEFISFIFWIKNYNLNHPNDMVNIYGVFPLTPIPLSYFLSAYIYPLDSSFGKKMSEKWTSHGISETVAYADMKSWIKLKRTGKINESERDLLNGFENDLLHNSSIIKIDSLTQKFPASLLNKRSSYVANQIQAKIEKRSIFVTSNTDVVTTQIKPSFVLEEIPINSIGTLLKSLLKNRYYVFVSDFAGSAQLKVVNLVTRSLDDEVYVSSDQAKTLRKKKDFFNLEKNDSGILNGYCPLYLSLFNQLNSQTIVEKKGVPFNTLFLYFNLSAIDFSN
jgi:hypothetical protein